MSKNEKYGNKSTIQQEFDAAMVNFFADSFVPFYVASKDSFRNVIDVANKRLTVKHPTTYSKQAEDLSKNIM